MSEYLNLTTEPDPSIPAIDQEIRRRTLWSLYLLDTMISCGRQRTAMISVEHITTQVPYPEATFRQGAHCTLPTLAQFMDVETDTQGLDGENPWGLLVLATAHFDSCLRYMFSESRQPAGEVPWLPTSNFAKIELLLLKLETTYGFGEPIVNLHSTFHDGSSTTQEMGPLVYSHALFHASNCLLYHPFLLRKRLVKTEAKPPRSFLQRAFHSCQKHAKSLAALIAGAKTAGVHPTASMYAYFAFLAASINVLFLQSNSKMTADQISNDPTYSFCLKHLEHLSEYWLHAKSMVRSFG